MDTFELIKGAEEDEIVAMVRKNPARALGLPVL